MQEHFEIDKDKICLIDKLDLIKNKIETTELRKKLEHIKHEFLYHDTGQLEEDRISSPIEMFKPKGGEFIKKKWEEFLEKNKNPFLSLYIHIPFCPKRCRYCMFYSTILERKEELERYLNYLEEQMKFFAPIFTGKIFNTLYIGGGTPSIFDSKQLERLFKSVYKNFNISKNGQLTFEASPYTLNKEKINVIDKYVNRLALGIQSLDREVLEKNNRPYISYNKLKELFNYIKSKNFQGFDVDLMLGLNGDTEKKFLKSFEDILKLGPYSIALYKILASHVYTADLIRKLFPGQKGNVNVDKNYQLANYDMQEIFKKMKPLLKKYNYIGEHSAQYTTPRFWKNKKPEIDSPNKWYLPYYNAQTHNSVLGIGIGAESYITYEFEYRNIDNVKGNYSLETTKYYAHEINLKDQMRSYIVSSICSRAGIPWISITNFRKKFGKDIFEEFREELEILARLGILVKYKDKIILFPKNDYERAFATRIFV